MCDERADDVMKQSRNLLCGWASILFGSVNLKLGCVLAVWTGVVSG